MAKTKKVATKPVQTTVTTTKKPFNWACCCIVGAIVFLLFFWILYELVIKWIVPVPFL